MKVKYILILLLFYSNVRAQNRGLVGENSSKIPSGTEKRLALVVGNNNYLSPDSKLQNAVNDANDISASLETLGFNVMKSLDLDEKGFKIIVDQFTDSLVNYNVALFYYSGHAVQFDGENYLIPTDTKIDNAAIKYDCVNLGRVMDRMEASGVKNSLLFLDACRNNPFLRSSARSTPQRGLVIPVNPRGSRVVFATGAGDTADDNRDSRNGLFTGELLKHLTTPDLTLSEIIERTRVGVDLKSNGDQRPADYNNILGRFYFIKTDKTLEENQKKFDNQLKTGLDFANQNRRKESLKYFIQANTMATENAAIDSKELGIKSAFYENKANRFFQYEEYFIAKEWFQVAQALNDTEEITNKIKACDDKL